MGIKTERLSSSYRRSWRRWFLVAQAVFRLILVTAALAIIPFRLAIRMGSVARGRMNETSIDDIVGAIETAARRLPWRLKCIERGIAAQHMLRAAGYGAILHYGARHHPQTGALEAHVWVTLDGAFVIGGHEASGFALLASYPSEVM